MQTTSDLHAGELKYSAARWNVAESEMAEEVYFASVLEVSGPAGQPLGCLDSNVGVGLNLQGIHRSWSLGGAPP